MISLSINKSKATPLSWLLSALLIVAPVSEHALAGFMLCFESDGRVEIEAGDTGDCASDLLAGSLESHGHSPLASPEASIQCGSSCIDIPLFANPVDGSPAVKKGSSVELPSLATGLRTDDSSHLASRKSTIPSFSGVLVHDGIGVSRSVVMLI